MSVTIPFSHISAGHCASGAFRDLFEFKGYRHHGETLSEALVFGLAAGLDVMYMSRPSPKMPFYLGGRSPLIEESLLTRIGGTLYRRADPDSDSAWTWLREHLDRGEPTALVADCQKLEYLKTRSSMPLHVIVATGYDDTHVLIADNDRAEIQRCSMESLRAARSAHGFPLPAMNVTFEIEWPTTIPPVETMLQSALEEIVTWMREPTGPAVAIFGAETFGLAAINRLEGDATAWMVNPPLETAVFAMILWIAIEKGGTGGGFFRKLFRDFLAEANRLAPSPSLGRALAHYTELADAWTALGSQCTSGWFAGIPERLVALARAERIGVTLLDAAARDGQ